MRIGASAFAEYACPDRIACLEKYADPEKYADSDKSTPGPTK